MGNHLSIQVSLAFSADLIPDNSFVTALMPRSSVHITELGQVFALMIGVITLVCSIRDVRESVRREECKDEEVEIREEMGLGDRRLQYLGSIIGEWPDILRGLKEQLYRDPEDARALERLRSREEPFVEIISREKLFEHGSTEHTWLRRKMDY
ncbi:uncharacterized protein DNG_08941 [Cephalotrichum gorgonifer]|uniref:Uncharacterized protein n=1 Tax=Cephalotrichum gorgonifer TaxID=2041049 RepID=A0AAE8N7E7_9PEZI|nr:uncharacterized protein DNG_08941 [Cephalotrichum gorgonifer]